MNLRRGLLRARVVVSILWVGICAVGWDIGSGFDRERYDEYTRRSDPFLKHDPNPNRTPCSETSDESQRLAKAFEESLQWRRGCLGSRHLSASVHSRHKLCRRLGRGLRAT